MTEPSAGQTFDAGSTVKKSTLAMLSLLVGWLGAHKFYVGADTLGGLYFALLIFGIVFTAYVPFWIAFVPVGLIILLVPFVLSIIEFFRFRRMSEGAIASRYRRSQEKYTLVFVTQILFLLILIIPLIARMFS